MNKDSFYNILSHPYSITSEDKEFLDEILEEYPFFQAGQTLRLQNAYGTDKYERLLQQNGIHIPDPKYYYRKLMLNKMYVQTEVLDEEILPTEKDVVDEGRKDTKGRFTEAENKEKDKKERETLQYAPSFYKIEESKNPSPDLQKESHNFTDWLNVLDQSAQKESAIENPKAKKTAATISQFIDKDKKPIKKPKATVTKEKEKDYSPEQLMSQTLAEIYVKQKLYDKAIAIYEKLDLKSSEKNATFARRIDEINELKNN
ncbi:hypothetical protein C7377_0354 [Balneicella halophila]|uniref:Tetratricopeptide repeat protein n=1 Tax=Balneicella halophila TaxID=1537566 RepID=A0A7L4UQW3_BALHA|nr:hypothetical protein [Balneicella halophila]PVX52059.1 hypothetical protein C7377_0354 [Balneicella halophila]